MKTFIIPEDKYQRIMKLLGEIEAKIGPYKMDNFEHALSVMDNSTENAKEIKELFRNSFAEEVLSSSSTVKEIEQ